MSNIEHDSHLCCQKCRGSACNLSSRCEHCKSWSEEEMDAYLKHQASLVRKRRFRERQRVKAKEHDNLTANSNDSSPREIASSEFGDESDVSGTADNVPVGLVEHGQGNGKANYVGLMGEQMSEGMFANLLSNLQYMIEESLDRKLERFQPDNSIPCDTSALGLDSGKGKSGPFKNSRREKRVAQGAPPAKKLRNSRESVTVIQVGESSQEAEATQMSQEGGQTNLEGTQTTQVGTQATQVGTQATQEGTQATQQGTQLTQEGLLGTQAAHLDETVKKGNEYLEYYDGDEYYDDDDEYYEGEEESQMDFHNQNKGASGAENREEAKSFSEDTTFRKLLEVITEFFPHAKLPEVKEQSRACLHENYFTEIKRKQSPARLTLYDRIGTVRSDLEAMVSRLMKGGKKAGALLPHKRKTYCVAGDESFSEPPRVNEEIRRILGDGQLSNPYINISAEDLKNLENALLSIQQNQSFSLWVISTLFIMIHKAGFSGPNADVLSTMSSTLSGSMVNQSTLAHQISAFLVTKRREALLESLPSLAEVHKNRLTTTTPFSKTLFDQATLESVLEGCEKDANWRALMTRGRSAQGRRIRRGWRVRGNSRLSHQVGNNPQQHSAVKPQSDLYALPPNGGPSAFGNIAAGGRRLLGGRRRVGMTRRTGRAGPRRGFQ